MLKKYRLLSVILITSFIFCIAYFTHFYQFYTNYEQKTPSKTSPAQVNIILNALPKSGSSYLEKLLRTGLEYDRLNIISDYDPNTNKYDNTMIIPKYKTVNIPEFFKNQGMIAKQHLRAPVNLQATSHLGPPILDVETLKQYSNKIVIHVRDPRQVLLSLVHDINKLKHRRDARVGPERPVWYYELSLDKQIDWCIQHILPNVVAWINDWLILKEREDLKSNGLRVLITTYDEMIQDDQALCQKILNFYNIPVSNFNYTSIAHDADVKFRNGDPNEWRDVYTAEQKQRIAAVVPQSLLDRFGW